MKVYFETFGCTSNRADTQIMEGLVEVNHELVEGLEECDVAVINSCAVIEHTQRKVIKRVREVKDVGKKVVLAGCLSKIDPGSLLECRPDCAIPPSSINLINQALDAASEGTQFRPINLRSDKPSLIRKLDGEVIVPIPIAEGCLGSCSYCATRSARGRLRSFGFESIINAAEKAVSSGCRELQLTGQDTGIYGKDTGRSLAELLTEICRVKGDFRIRVGMMNPSFVVDVLDALVEAFDHEKVYKFLHLPVQSGDDEVLEHMQRGYTIEDFTSIVEKFRKGLLDLTLSTDVIVGYPAEDETSFLKTYQLIERIKPDILNITRFSPRPNTPADMLKDIPDRIKKERSRKMSSLARKISTEINKKYLGRVEEVLITEHGKNGTLLARMDSYKQVVLKDGKVGEFKKVKIRDTKAHYLIAG